MKGVIKRKPPEATPPHPVESTIEVQGGKNVKTKNDSNSSEVRPLSKEIGGHKEVETAAEESTQATSKTTRGRPITNTRLTIRFQ